MGRFVSDTRIFYRSVPLLLEFRLYDRGRLVYPNSYGVEACIYTTQLSRRFWGVSLLEGQSSAHVASAGVTITRRRSSWVLELQPSVLECMPVGELHIGVSYLGVGFNSGEVFTLPRLSDITVDCGV